ncbi:MAG: MBL fold metallo-hydrolase [Deinococcus sp.]|nr:MBL fold metallo-hydrolase [Deinococcus sp.]
MIHILDLHYRAPRTIASFVIDTPEGPVVIETGPESCFAALEKGLAGFGYSREDVRHVFVTHIHLDHAGAAWRFAQHGATIYVHPKGAPHLADPSKLWASATRIYGDQMRTLWGRMEPVGGSQIRTLADGQVITFGNTKVKALEAPGHAPHHLAFQVEDALFGGDAAGVRIGGGPAVPPCPPPDIHVEGWRETLARIRSLGLDTLYLTHFGAYTDVESHLDTLEETLHRWSQWIKNQLRSGKAQEQITPLFEHKVAAELLQAGLSQAEVSEYEIADPAWMSVQGLSRYWQKFHPEEILAT